MNSVFALERRFRLALTNECGVTRGIRLLVAVSGGPDSVALLRLLIGAAESLKLEVVVAHLDHGLRLESSNDAEFVRSLASGLHLPLVHERLSVPELAAARKCGLEEAARGARREFLLRNAASQECHVVALGHQRGDQAETVLHRLVRGTGTTGLAAMRPRYGNIIRPLLGFSRSELLDYLQAIGQPYVTDASNGDPKFTRNRIRAELLPLLNSFNPRIEEHLAGLSRRLAHEEDYWREEVDRIWQQIAARRDGEQVVLDCEHLLSLHRALRARVLRRALLEAGVLGEVGSVHVDALDHLIVGSSPQAELNLPGGWAARRYRELWLAPAPPSPVAPWSRHIEAPGVYGLPSGVKLCVTLEAHARGQNASRAEFAARAIRFPLEVRTPRSGDRFRPSGMGGSKKLQDFFVDAQVAREERHCQPLVLAGDEILWLVGRRRCAGHLPVVGEEVLSLCLD